MAGNLSRPLTFQQGRLLDAIRAAPDGAVTTNELTRLRIYVNAAATRGAIRRLETRGLVRRATWTDGGRRNIRAT